MRLKKPEQRVAPGNTVLFQMRMPRALRTLLKKMQLQDGDGSESGFLRRLIKAEHNRRRDPKLSREREITGAALALMNRVVPERRTPSRRARS